MSSSNWKAMDGTDPELQEEVLDILRDEGPLSHDALTERAGFDNKDETQKVIRELRNKGFVAITVDRKYDLVE